MNKDKFILIAVGIISGILCGLLGVGGGVIIVLYLTHFLHEEQHTAQATAISVIFASAIVSSVIYGLNGVLDRHIITLTLIGSVIGGYCGAKMMKKISDKTLRKIFGAFMLLAGLRMLF